MATKTQSAVVAVFRNRTDAEAAASDLKANGFSANNILVSSDASAVDAASQPGGTYSDAGTHAHREHEGGIVGWFKSVFGEEEHGDRPYYQSAADSGHSFLSVDVTDESIDRAASVLNSHNPIDIHREDGAAEVEAADPLAAAPPTGAVPAYGAGTVPTGSREGHESGAIPVVREELKVGKRSVLKGGVRVYSRVIDEPVEETVRLRQEQVRVDRTPVNREATAADLRPGQERVFEVKEFAEEAVVSKQARVVEEVRIHKDETERTETIHENVRHTEVDVEDVAPGTSELRAGATGSAAGTALGANEEDFRRHYAATYGTAGGDYETYRPGYAYGYEIANDPRYRGRNFDEVESELKSDYSGRYPSSTWDRAKESVRYGWDKVTRKI